MFPVLKSAAGQVSVMVIVEVSSIELKSDRNAQLRLMRDKTLQIPLVSVASVKSQGIIGDKFIQISLEGDLEIFKRMI